MCLLALEMRSGCTAAARGECGEQPFEARADCASLVLLRAARAAAAKRRADARVGIDRSAAGRRQEAKLGRRGSLGAGTSTTRQRGKHRRRPASLVRRDAERSQAVRPPMIVPEVLSAPLPLPTQEDLPPDDVSEEERALQRQQQHLERNKSPHECLAQLEARTAFHLEQAKQVSAPHGH
eukprot:1186377-Prorocentrum_minimum.AAC.2